MKSKLLILIAYLFLPFSSFSQNLWEPLDGPNGNSISNTIVGDDGAIHIKRTASPYYMKSTDGGLSWEPTSILLANNHRFVKFYKAHDGEVYSLAQNAIHLWDGQLWVKLPFPQNIRVAKDISKMPDGRMVIVGFWKTVLSDQSGNNYTTLVSETVHNSFLVTPGGNNNFARLSTGGSKRLYRFDDNGGNFISMVNNIPNGGIIDIWANNDGRCLLTDYKDLYVSDDRGVNWRIIEIEPSASSQPLVYKLEEWKGGVVAAYSEQGIYISNDKGTSWSFFSDLGELNEQKNNVLFHQVTPREFFATFDNGCNGVFKSTDYMETWEEIPVNFLSPRVNMVQRNTATNIIYTETCSNLIQFLANDGSGWYPLNLPEKKLEYSDFITANSNHIYCSYFPNKVYRSADNGANWEQLNLPNGVNRVTSLKYHPYEDYLIIFSGANEGFYSSNNGEDWTPFQVPRGFINVFFEPDGSLYYFDSYVIVRQKDINANLEEFSITEFERGHMELLGVLNDGRVVLNGQLIDPQGEIGFMIYNLNTNDNEFSPGLKSYFISSNDDFIRIVQDSILISHDHGQTWENILGNLPRGKQYGFIWEDYEGYLYVKTGGDILYKREEPLSPNVSTNNIHGKNILRIYPNPTNTNFSIQLEKEVSGQLTIEVFDIFGKAVFEDTFRGKNYRAEKADLTQGTYLVRISGKEMKPLTRKLVKM